MNAFEKLRGNGVIAVLEIDNAEDALPTAQALYRGGVRTIELTLRSSASLEAARIIKANVPLELGIGTVILKGQCKAAKDLGAAFAVAPGFNPAIVQEAMDISLDFAPGVATPSELECAAYMGCKVFKVYPAVKLGGVDYLKSLIAPYRHLGFRYIPLGGMTLETEAQWAAVDEVLGIGGTWIASKSLIAAGSWSAIESNARSAVELWKSLRQA